MASGALAWLWPPPALGPGGGPAAGGARRWAAGLKAPPPGPARIIGGTGLGCIAGAVALPPDGPGWQAVRVSRNRHWGHPALVGFLRDFAGPPGAGLPALWIGDLASRGAGPCPMAIPATRPGSTPISGWSFPRSRRCRPPRGRISRSRPWCCRMRAGWTRALAPAACRADPAGGRAAGRRPGAGQPRHQAGAVPHRAGGAWLRLVRPWRGHDSHMHVRLRCPDGQPECRDQPPPPPGDGCDAVARLVAQRGGAAPPPRPPGPPAAPAAGLRGGAGGR